MSDSDSPANPTEAPASSSSGSEEATQKRLEILLGFTISIFAAVLALNELAAGKYGDDELQMNSERTSAYLWYQSKGIKQTLVEGQRDLLRGLLDGGSVPPEKAAGISKQASTLDERIARYELEKDELLRGSTAVGKANWRQEVDGELGKVVGVKAIEARLEQLGRGGDRFDLATLFLQLGLVLGAIGILMNQERMKKLFLGGLVVMGILGTTWWGLALHTVGFF